MARAHSDAALEAPRPKANHNAHRYSNLWRQLRGFFPPVHVLRNRAIEFHMPDAPSINDLRHRRPQFPITPVGADERDEGASGPPMPMNSGVGVPWGPLWTVLGHPDAILGPSGAPMSDLRGRRGPRGSPMGPSGGTSGSGWDSLGA